MSVAQLSNVSPGAVQPDLVLSGINKTYGGVVALENANLECFRGEIHALLGENGAGKSTLVKVLSGAVVANSGQITLFGKPLVIKNPDDSMRHGIGMVYQEFSLIPDLTVAANVYYGIEPRTSLGTIRTSKLREQTLALFKRLGMHTLNPDRTIRDLSLAQRQQVEIAKTLAREPNVLVFDEATSALSREEVDWLLALMRHEADSGKIVLFISHRLGEVKQVADRFTVFRNGRNVGSRLPNETDSDELVAMMLGRKAQRLFPTQRANKTQEVVLETVDLRLRGRHVTVNFRLHQGEILGVGGLVGQGQDELFLSLFGIEQAAGTILIRHKPTRIRSPRDALRAGVGLALVPEDRANQGLVLQMALRDNISMAILSTLSRLGFINRRRESAEASSMIDRLRIVATGFDQPVARLSGGNQQKVVLAKLLLAKPSILLLADSTRGVDVGTKAEVFDLLRSLAEQGTAVLFYSTDLEELVNVCDRVLVMYDGGIAAELIGSTLTETNIVRASMGEVVILPAQPAVQKLEGEGQNGDQ
jgi:ribose transport system ATP-binding protein